jgi:hypothetical protein
VTRLELQVCFLFFIYILFTLTFYTYRLPDPPLEANKGQRRPTTANEGQHRPLTATQANDGQYRSTTANEGQRMPTQVHDSHTGCYNPSYFHCTILFPPHSILMCAILQRCNCMLSSLLLHDTYILYHMSSSCIKSINHPCSYLMFSFYCPC